MRVFSATRARTPESLFTTQTIVSGQYPDGTPIGPDELGSDFVIEQADLFYNDFPAYCSPADSLTFGRSYVPGEDLAIGPLASVR